MVSIIAMRAIRPIEKASQESLEELVTAEEKVPEVSLEEALDAEATAR